MVDFEWYRSFIAVYRAGTVTGAAEARYLTQPAISQHIAALETDVGQALFVRKPRKMVPSEYGKALYSRVAPAMDNLEKVSANLNADSFTKVPIIRLGAPLDYFYEVGFETLKCAEVRLEVEFGDTATMIDSLSSGKLDAVIATQQVDLENIDYVKIDQEEFCLVASPDISLPTTIQKDAEQKTEIEHFLLKQQWVSFSAELPIIRRFWHSIFQRRPNIEPQMVVPSLLLIRKAVECGLGISVLPRYICDESISAGRLKILWEAKEPMVNDLWIASRKVDRNKPEIGKITSFMRH